MQKITPHLWFDKEAEEAAEYYASIFKNSKIGSVSRYTDAGQEIHKQKAGTAMTVEFELEGYKFVALNGGPIFKFNPSISFFVRCASESEIDELYNKLSEGGEVLMPFQKYPFSEKYAWISDKYGVSWQLFLGDSDKQKIAPCLLFVGEQNGKTEKAMNLYTSLFPDSKIGDISRYGKGQEPNPENNIQYASFFLCNQEFTAMDGGLDHKFTFNEAVSLLVNCDTQEEIDRYWNTLSAHPESEQCGWLKDKFGVSWQITPTILGELFNTPDPEKSKRVMNTMLKMKKLDIEKLKQASE